MCSYQAGFRALLALALALRGPALGAASTSEAPRGLLRGSKLVTMKATPSVGAWSLQEEPISESSLPRWWQDMKAATERSAGNMETMTAMLDNPDHEAAFRSYMSIYPQGEYPNTVLAWGMNANMTWPSTLHGRKGTSDRGIYGHYTFVMTVFKPVLVTDVMIAAGDLAVERYHAAKVDIPQGGFAFNDCDDDGDFSNDGSSNAPEVLESHVMGIRGQTVYKFDHSRSSISESCIERWSNHDHGYDTNQTCNNLSKGDEVRRAYSGGFPDDSKLENRGSFFLAKLSKYWWPLEKHVEEFLSVLTEDAQIFGVSSGTGSKDDLRAYLQGLWSSFPDLVYHKNGDATAWGYLAINYQASGTFRGAHFYGRAPHGQPVELHGTLIVKFNNNDDLLVEKMWIFDRLDEVVLKKY